MAQPTYNESAYRFIDPVRYFKANDPYFFEVDNIPLKQLQENCLWLKDQVGATTQGLLKVKRQNIEELRPFANGADRVVRVNPGRFTARINNIQNKERLAYLKMVAGGGQIDTHAPNQWEVGMGSEGAWPPGVEPSWNNLLFTALEKFKSNLAQDALGMTGLEERVGTFPILGQHRPINNTGIYWANIGGAISYSGNYPGVISLLPAVMSRALLWAKSTNQDFWIADTWSHEQPYDVGWALQVFTESQFIKKWRGIARNAIVDVPEELTIEVPPFDPTDFNYIDEEGVEQTIDGLVSRIDLVFIYSKPVDTSAVRIYKGYGPNTSQISTPQLGMVRGAGIKMNYQPLASLPPENTSIVGTDLDGNPMILAAPGDVNDTNMGFTAASGNDIAFDVRGSFPAPDDILNIAPMLAEGLEANALELVGQTVLPVAYVWVQSDSSMVGVTDIIDIRPLFRTAELTYSERTGIAAAVPQISLANPVAGLNYVDKKLESLRLYTEEEIANSTANQPQSGFALMGYIYGGWQFGPEAALYDYEYRKTHPNSAGNDHDPSLDWTDATTWATLESKYNLGTSPANIPQLPEWEIAEWVQHPNNIPTGGWNPSMGQIPTDYMTNFGSFNPTDNGGCFLYQCEAPSVMGASRSSRKDQTPPRDQPDTMWAFAGGESCTGGLQYGMDCEGAGPTPGTGVVSKAWFTFVKKRIDFLAPPNMLDYDVDVKLVNCLAQNYAGQPGATNSGDLNYSYQAAAATYFGSWVEKGKDYFIIYYAFNSRDINKAEPTRTDTTRPLHMLAPHRRLSSGPLLSVRDYQGVNDWGAFVVPVQDMLEMGQNIIGSSSYPGRKGYWGNPRLGRCSLPTVQWTLTKVDSTESERHVAGLPDGPITIP